REFVKSTMGYYPETKFYFAHPKNPRMFEDISNLKYAKIQPFMRGDRHFIIGNERDLYINTWIGLNGKYVGPGVACSIDRHQLLWNDLMDMIGLKVRFDGSSTNYIPRIDYTKLNPKYINRIETFINRRPMNRKVLLCNGNVQSNQAKNFDFEPVIKLLCEEFPKTDFITTSRVSFQFPNLYYTGNIIQSNDNFDLNEISYLSTFTPIIVGRSSGPFSFTQVAQNYTDKSKTFLSFSYHKEGGHLVMKGKTKAKRYWSGVADTQGVFKKIRSVIVE
ncbi:hypothetical protein LCGC14_0482750, partial [marine sediment metagenome]